MESQPGLADAFYILADGVVDVFLEAPDRAPQLMAQLTAGMFFGEISWRGLPPTLK